MAGGRRRRTRRAREFLPRTPATGIKLRIAFCPAGIYNSPVTFTFEHLGLAARDPLALKNWYVRVLGARVVFESNEGFPVLLAFSGTDSMIEIYAGDSSLPDVSNNKLNGWRHVAVRVPSLEVAKADLEKCGVQFTESPRPAAGGGRILFFQDPEGNLLHLVERTADSALPPIATFAPNNPEASTHPR
jgi:glyoxylase I family protein